jgi:hypothetical protein
MRSMSAAFLVLCLALLSGTRSSVAAPPSNELSVDPVVQESPVWCWAAVAEMVFEYYDVPNGNAFGDFQCAIASLVHPACANNCGNCIVSAPSMPYLRDVLQNYPVAAAKALQETVPRIITNAATGTLSSSRISDEIDADRPVVVGISPSGFSYRGQPQHVALIVGYDDSDENFRVTVNDPFPYDAFPNLKNPYLEVGADELEGGKYSISYDAFVKRLRWSDSIPGIRTSGNIRPPQSARQCVTPFGACQMAVDGVPVGTPCTCATYGGPVGGVAR